ncbi:MAG TPA: PAS domain S-box protein, partial [Vicinamibacterales bacterium]
MANRGKPTLRELELVVDTMSAAAACLSRDLRYVWVSRVFTEWLRMDPSDVIGHPIVDVIGPEALESIRPHIERVLRGERVEYEQDVAYRSIGPRYVRVVYVPTFGKDAEPDGWVAVARDVTEDRERRESTRAGDLAARRLAAVVESSGDVVISKDLDGIITSWNPAAERIFGYTADEMVGRSIRTIIPQDRQYEEDDVLARIRRGESVEHFETIRQTKDGRLIPLSLTVSPIRDRAGTIVGATKIARDIAAQREASITARRLAAIVESSDDVIVSKDLNGIVVSWNRAAERILGFTAEEMIGRSIRTIIPADRQTEEDEVLARVRRGERVDHFETIRQRKDGTLVPVALTVSPVRDDSGRIVGASKIARDISEHHQIAQRTAFLVEAGKALTASLDPEKPLQSMVNLAVPLIADWCAVDVVRDGRVHRVGMKHADPEKMAIAAELQRRDASRRSPYSPASVIRTGQTAFVAEITDEMLETAAADDEERLRLIRALGLRSYLCMPL